MHHEQQRELLPVERKWGKANWRLAGADSMTIPFHSPKASDICAASPPIANARAELFETRNDYFNLWHVTLECEPVCGGRGAIDKRTGTIIALMLTGAAFASTGKLGGVMGWAGRGAT